MKGGREKQIFNWKQNPKFLIFAPYSSPYRTIKQPIKAKEMCVQHTNSLQLCVLYTFLYVFLRMIVTLLYEAMLSKVISHSPYTHTINKRQFDA